MTVESKTGLLLCNFGSVSSVLDVDRIRKTAESAGRWAEVLEGDLPRGGDGSPTVESFLDEHGLDDAVLVAASLSPSGDPAEALKIKEAIDEERVEVVDLAAFLSWEDAEWARLRADLAVRSAVVRRLKKDDLEFQEIEVSNSVVILGNNPCASAAAAEISSLGGTAVVVCEDAAFGKAEGDENIEFLTSARVMAVDGTPGAFQVRVADSAGAVRTVQAGGVILAEDRDVETIAERLGIAVTEAGFYRIDLDGRPPMSTTRSFILAVGPARGNTDTEEGIEEAVNAVRSLWEYFGTGRISVAVDRVKLDKRKCTVCLTCYRLCPHHAVLLPRRKPVYSDLACHRCGICASECPQEALQLHNNNDAQIKSVLQVAAGGVTPPSGDFVPSIVAFCCRESSVKAYVHAVYGKLELPKGLFVVEMPCVGKVDDNYVLTAFREGADGVMVLGSTHEGCKSDPGSRLAESRMEALAEIVKDSGLDPDRLFFAGMDADDTEAFSQLALEFEALLKNLGESGVRKFVREKRAA